MTDDLRAFLEARLAEDERGALIGGIAPDPWQAITDGNSGPAVRTGADEAPEWQREVNYQMWHCDDEADGCPEIAREWIAEARHIARHDPARVLREVAAKRAILARHPVDTYGACEGCGYGRWDGDTPWVSDAEECPELRIVASVFTDHPDYRTSWAPETVIPGS